jgi:hypothetical protein
MAGTYGMRGMREREGQPCQRLDGNSLNAARLMPRDA